VEAEATLPVTLAREMVVDRNRNDVLALEEGLDGQYEKCAEQDADTRPNQSGTFNGLSEHHVVGEWDLQMKL